MVVKLCHTIYCRNCGKQLFLAEVNFDKHFLSLLSNPLLWYTATIKSGRDLSKFLTMVLRLKNLCAKDQ